MADRAVIVTRLESNSRLLTIEERKLRPFVSSAAELSARAGLSASSPHSLDDDLPVYIVRPKNTSKKV